MDPITGAEHRRGRLGRPDARPANDGTPSKRMLLLSFCFEGLIPSALFDDQRLFFSEKTRSADWKIKEIWG